MASHQRNERLLMRQRGAGRDVPVTDFNLNFGFQSTRVSGRSSRSRSKTPGRQPQKAPRNSQASVRSRRSASAVSNTQPSVAPKEQVQSQERPTKRRRTTIAPWGEVLEEIEQVPEPVQVGSDEGYQSDGGAPEQPGGDSNDKENDTPGQQKRPLKKKKRKSIGQQSERNKKRLSDQRKREAGQRLSAGPAPPFISVPEDDHPDQSNIVVSGDVNEPESDVQDGSVRTESPVAAVKPTISRKRRGKRKSITFEHQRKKRRISQQSSEAADDDGSEVALSQVTRAISNRRTASAPRISASRSVSPLEYREEDASEDDYAEVDGSPDPTTPTTRNRSKAGRKEKGSQAAKRASHSNGKASFPILTHRLTNSHMLPRIDEAGESDLDSEDERARESQLKLATERPVPNAVDVLAQYCREMVETEVKRLEVGVSSNRAERKRKQTAVERVGQELNDRLFEMSDAIEARIQLEVQARRAKKEKAELQAQWLQLRAQREDVALRCDHIRQQNWQRDREREAKWTISEAARQTEMELDRSEEQTEESLEYLLRTVAVDVSNSQGGGGLLDQIKSFNTRLERMAGVLEGRT
ncbi:uncharacterized protein AB675_798 [Cyphellophora attinorum]|uniref:Inner kinetochore subunit AME1 domain-containing protein n=1 Tax=Cyphellophora attinorum TaxID=1664694 RepID=A0A0N1P3R7_9EURO|nr:uncharacterized protein AB675_798 [Phialophora attinorum]KPI45683.1 hypothetical protein AB675_798 [Phialophora attinorum]